MGKLSGLLPGVSVGSSLAVSGSEKSPIVGEAAWLASVSLLRPSSVSPLARPSGSPDWGMPPIVVVSSETRAATSVGISPVPIEATAAGISVFPFARAGSASMGSSSGRGSGLRLTNTTISRVASPGSSASPLSPGSSVSPVDAASSALSVPRPAPPAGSSLATSSSGEPNRESFLSASPTSSNPNSPLELVSELLSGSIPDSVLSAVSSSEARVRAPLENLLWKSLDSP